jgi:hypothetical protein
MLWAGLQVVGRKEAGLGLGDRPRRAEPLAGAREGSPASAACRHSAGGHVIQTSLDPEAEERVRIGLGEGVAAAS